MTLCERQASLFKSTKYQGTFAKTEKKAHGK